MKHDVDRNSAATPCYAMLRNLPDRDAIERFFDDEMVVVGWPDSKEILFTIGSNTELNRQIGDFVAEAIRSMIHVYA